MIHLEIELPRGSLFSTAARHPFEVKNALEKQRLFQTSFISGGVTVPT
jgi:hypothetical protein